LSFEVNKLFYPKIIHWPRRTKCNILSFLLFFKRTSCIRAKYSTFQNFPTLSRNIFKCCSVHNLFSSPTASVRAVAQQTTGSIGVSCRTVFEAIWSHAGREYRFASSVIGSYTPLAKANRLSALVSANTTQSSYHHDLRRT